MQSQCYDLHSHTYFSDGRLSPAALVARAVSMNVDVLAITDHDTIAGLPEAYQAIRENNFPLTLISGVEISTRWHNFDIHIVGLGFDATSPLLIDFLEQQRQLRILRAKAISEQLAKLGINDAYEKTVEMAGCDAVTRAHFAHYLVSINAVSSKSAAFRRFLKKGRSAYVTPTWGTIERAVDVIHQTGGVAVLAHPARYGLSAKWQRRLLSEFKIANGDAIEVAQCHQSSDITKELAKLAQEFSLLASQGSDFHEPTRWCELGQHMHLPDTVTPVWHHFNALAKA